MRAMTTLPKTSGEVVPQHDQLLKQHSCFSAKPPTRFDLLRCEFANRKRPPESQPAEDTGRKHHCRRHPLRCVFCLEVMSHSSEEGNYTHRCCVYIQIIYIYIYISSIYIYIYVHTYIYVYIYIYVCIHITYVYIYIYI